MPSADPSPALKALKYAEEALNVHGVHDEALAARERLDKIVSELVGAKTRRKALEDNLRDREVEIAAEQWGAHPDFSATKMDGFLKSVRHGDAVHQQVRGDLAAVASIIETLEYEKQLVEVDIKIAVARMNELGGMLTYLAAIKRSQTTPEKPREAGESE